MDGIKSEISTLKTTDTATRFYMLLADKDVIALFGQQPATNKSSHPRANDDDTISVLEFVHSTSLTELIRASSLCHLLYREEAVDSSFATVARVSPNVSKVRVKIPGLVA